MSQCTSDGLENNSSPVAQGLKQLLENKKDIHDKLVGLINRLDWVLNKTIEKAELPEMEKNIKSNMVCSSAIEHVLKDLSDEDRVTIAMIEDLTAKLQI